MKKIPLNSLVIIDKLYDIKFPENELIDFNSFKTLYHTFPSYEIQQSIENEFKKFIFQRLNFGQRCFVKGPEDNVMFTKDLLEGANSRGYPTFQILSENNHTHIKTETIRFGIDDFEIIPYPNTPSHKISKTRGITVIGDIHGMYQSLMDAINWARSFGHYIIFLGDILDYGPDSIECVTEVYKMVIRGEAELILGNHERKIYRWLRQYEQGNIKLKLSSGNKVTTNAFEALGPSAKVKWMNQFYSLWNISRFYKQIDNYMFVHASVTPEMWNNEIHRPSKNLESFAVFGEVDHTVVRDDGYPHRTHNWVDLIPNDHKVFVGHEIRDFNSPVRQASKSTTGEAIFLDTGSGKDGRLSVADLKFKNGKLVLQNFKTF